MVKNNATYEEYIRLEQLSYIADNVCLYFDPEDKKITANFFPNDERAEKILARAGFIDD